MDLSQKMSKIRPATAFPFTLGVFTGTLLTTFLLLAVRSMDQDSESAALPHQSSPLVTTQPPVELPEPNTASQTLSVMKTISYNVLSTKEHLESRVLAIHRTWASSAPDVEYFLYPPGGEREINFAAKRRLSVASLGTYGLLSREGVFDLWTDICERKADQFRWFAKLKDDVYVRTTALEELLSSMNSSEPHLIGRPVYPIGAERDELGMRPGERYCMESGYVISQGAMVGLCAALSHCRENAKSENEDVEIARCIRKYSKTNCTAAAEMNEFFYNAEDDIDKEQLQLGEHSLNPTIKRALLLSPMEEPDHFYHFHIYQANKDLRLKKHTVQEMREKLLQAAELSAKTDSLVHTSLLHSPTWTKLGVNPPHFPESKDEQVTHFQMFDATLKYTESLHYPVHSATADESRQITELEKAVTVTLANETGGGKLQFHSLMQRFEPQRGIDYFSQVSDSHQGMLVHSLREVELPQVLSAQTAGYRTTKVNFVVAAPSVSRGFQRFMMSFETSFLARDPPELVGLLVVLYSDDGPFKRYDEDLHAVTTLLNLYKGKYPDADLRFISTQNQNSRVETLTIASNEFPSYELLFLADIHIDFSTKFIERCRMNAVESKQVYFPAVFNPYYPDHFYKSRILYPHATRFQISGDRGNWMHESYHIACVYNYDLANALQLQQEQEMDLPLVEMFLQLNKLTVFRSVEPGLVHLWQDGCKDEHMGGSEQALCEKLDHVLNTT